MSRKHNFSAGPAALPLPVLESVQADLLDAGHGASILETSHRSPLYSDIMHSANDRLRRLLDIPDSHDVLWLQGGASHQFTMIPMNFLPKGRSAAYVLTGVWSEKAIQEALILGNARVAATGGDDGFRGIPDPTNWDLNPDDAYVHLTSNNTIYGTQFSSFPENLSSRLVCDMSSDILCRRLDVNAFDLIYAGAQKNLGPAGVTLAILRKDWLEEANDGLPTILRYSTHAEKESRFNTPPVFPIYFVGKVLEWIEANGGLEAVEARNQRKAALIYDLMDANPDYYRGHASIESRSQMNITFRLPDASLDARFIEEAAKANLVGLKGHRSVGGIRASIYNAVPEEAVEALAQFMRTFVRDGA